MTGLCAEMNRTSRTKTMVINRRMGTSTWRFRFKCHFIGRCRLNLFFEPKRKNKNRAGRSSYSGVERLLERREGNGTIEERFLFVDAFIKLLKLCQESRIVFRVGEVFLALHLMWNNLIKLQKFYWDVSIRGKDYSLIELRKLAFTKVGATLVFWGHWVEIKRCYLLTKKNIWRERNLRKKETNKQNNTGLQIWLGLTVANTFNQWFKYTIL